MPIRVQCPCGKLYDVDEKYAGKSFTCKACSQSLRVPTPVVQEEVIEEVAVVSVEPAAPMPTGPVASAPPTPLAAAPTMKSDATAPVARSASARAPSTAGRAAHSSHLVDPDQRQMSQQLEHLVESTGTAASNPGMMRVSLLRWTLAFPKWPAIWHGGLLLFLGLGFVHWAFWIILPLFLFAIYIYWRNVRNQFVAGCVNPAQVVSLNPPLVAVMTNLTKARRIAM